MKQNLSPEIMAAVFQKALKANKATHTDSSIIFQDLSFLLRRIDYLKSLFPENTLHGVAVKANPLIGVLEGIKPSGVGAECATLSEVYLAQKAGYPADKIIFDSPAKTQQELLYALDAGIYINADSFTELARIHAIIKPNHKSKIGLRVNPQIGEGRISATSTAGKYSKFGVPLDEFKKEIVNCYQKYNWLTGIHFHIGSQGVSLQQLLEAAKKVCSFIETHGLDLNFLDIGGGLPVKYKPTDQPPLLEHYVAELRQQCPLLFSGKFQLLTEFGRFLHANAGFTVSRVEYVKNYSGVNTAVIHVGADLLMRRAYNPLAWYHEISVMDPNGKLKPTLQTEKYTIAGPLCFGGDILGVDFELAVVDEGDYLILHDTGGYTLSMWSHHTNRLIPKVLGYEHEGERIFTLRPPQTLEDVYNFWK